MLARATFGKTGQSDKEFQKQWQEALAAGVEALEDEANRRATGYHEDTWDGEGNLVKRQEKHSDTMLMFMMRAAKPEKYRDNHKGDGAGEQVNIPLLRRWLKDSLRPSQVAAMYSDARIALSEWCPQSGKTTAATALAGGLHPGHAGAGAGRARPDSLVGERLLAADASGAQPPEGYAGGV